MDDDLLIGELALLCAVSTDTIRHYESLGVIAPAERSANGYRRFPRSAADRVRLVRRAIAIGFSLDEIARIFRRRASGEAPCRDVRALAAEKLDDVTRRIEEMTAVRDDLKAVIEQWDVRLAASPDGRPAFLLESLAKGEQHETDRDDHRRPLRPRRLR